MATVNSPTIQLSLLRGTGCTPRQGDFQSVEKRRLRCNPKGFWNVWQEEVLGLSQDWRTSTKELVLSAQVKCAAGSKKVKVLVETGAKIPLVFMQGLFNRNSLKKASFPVHFSTVDGQSMDGGTHGLFLEFRLPVWS